MAMASVGNSEQARRDPSSRGGAAGWSAVDRLQASVLVLAAAGGLVAFATFGAFDNRSDPFPQSVSGPVSIGGTTTGS